MHVALILLLAYSVERLTVAHGAKGGDGKHLRLSARKHGAAVRAAQYTYLRPYWAYLLMRAAIGTYILVYDFIPYYLFGEAIKDIVYIRS